jgi:hypothetical protein
MFLLSTFVPEMILFKTLSSTASACSKPSCGQICGQKPLPQNPGSGFVCMIVPYHSALIKCFYAIQLYCYKQRIASSENHVNRGAFLAIEAGHFL